MNCLNNSLIKNRVRTGAKVGAKAWNGAAVLEWLGMVAVLLLAVDTFSAGFFAGIFAWP